MRIKDHHKQAPVLYIPHGGGPLPLLGDEGHHELSCFLGDIGNKLDRPGTIIVVSAHWEENIPSLTSGTAPGLLYDYSGFPQAAYQISYPAPGNPELAHRMHSLMLRHGISAKLDASRDFDHGLFVPLKLMFPAADIPCIQLSLVNSLDPRTHIDIGAALQDIRKEDVLIIGSGFSFHNMQAFRSRDAGQVDAGNEAFEDWLIDTCTSEYLGETERRQKLIDWQRAPYATYCHPRAEHLLPLHICYGLGQSRASLLFKGQVLNKQTSAFLW